MNYIHFFKWQNWPLTSWTSNQDIWNVACNPLPFWPCNSETFALEALFTFLLHVKERVSHICIKLNILNFTEPPSCFYSLYTILIHRPNLLTFHHPLSCGAHFGSKMLRKRRVHGFCTHTHPPHTTHTHTPTSHTHPLHFLYCHSFNMIDDRSLYEVKTKQTYLTHKDCVFIFFF